MLSRTSIQKNSALLADMRHGGDLDQGFLLHQAALDAVARRLVAGEELGIDAVDGGVVRPVVRKIELKVTSAIVPPAVSITALMAFSTYSVCAEASPTWTTLVSASS